MGARDLGHASLISPGRSRLDIHLRIDGHHIKHWASGGATDLDNLVLVCHRHHWLVHEGGWKLVRGVDGLLMSVAPLPVVKWQARPPDPTVTE